MSAVAENPVRQHFYEGMFLVDSGKFATDPDGVTGEIMAVLAKAGATVGISHRPWQDGKLAYEIQGMKKGSALHRVFHDAWCRHEDPHSTVSTERNNHPSDDHCRSSGRSLTQRLLR